MLIKQWYAERFRICKLLAERYRILFDNVSFCRMIAALIVICDPIAERRRIKTNNAFYCRMAFA